MDRATIIELRDFIVDNHYHKGGAIVDAAAGRFGLSREAIRYHIRKLVNDGVLLAEGNTKARRYVLPSEVLKVGVLPIGPDAQDDLLWRTEVRPALRQLGVPANVESAMGHGCTEMVNNAIDHSGASSYGYELKADPRSITLSITDQGIGIFEKIRTDCNLYDRRQALLELSKGKLTSDPSRHSGEGIFFTSRIFDRFAIISLDLQFVRTREGENWLLDLEERGNDMNGTTVYMEIKRDSDVDVQAVFKQFEDDEARFAKTHVPVSLAKFGEEELVSRSQARRLMARVEKFIEVLLDYAGVQTIGQAFADEVYRVWTASHPETSIVSMNTNADVQRMIARAQAAARAGSEQPIIPPIGPDEPDLFSEPEMEGSAPH